MTPPSFLKSTRRPEVVERMVTHLQSPLFRNGYSLVTSAAITSGLGMLYWILAARTYSAEVIGVNSALISTMIFLASLSQLNLTNGLIRFVPNFGRLTGRFILSAYLVSTAVALIASLIFVLGSGWWSPTLATTFQNNPLLVVWFVGATMTWCVFALQDSAMTGLRQATWVPLENFFFSVSKIILLLMFADMLTGLGLFASWTFSVAVLIVPVNLFIFRRLIPIHQQRRRNPDTKISAGLIARFVVGDYLASFFWMASTDLIPLLVVELVGTEANAYFYLTWMIAYSLFLVSRNMGLSLISEAAADEKRLHEYSYSILVQNGRLISLALLVILPGAPFILQLFGPSYVQEATGLLRLLCLSALPNVATALAVSIFRVQKRIKALMVLQGSLSAIVLLLSVLLLPRIGIIGVGIAWLVGQSIVAVVLLATTLRPVWLSPQMIRRLAKWGRPFLTARQAWLFWRQRGTLRQVHRQLAKKTGILWRLVEQKHTEGDLIVALVENEQGETAVLKATRNKKAQESLAHHADVLTQLHQMPALASLKPLIPEVIGWVELENTAVLLEQKLPGIALAKVPPSENAPDWGKQAISAIEFLHMETAVYRPIDQLLIDQWVTTPLHRLRHLSSQHSNQRRQTAIDQLERFLAKSLINRSAHLCWIHGDLTPGNILVNPQSGAIEALIDWEIAQPDNLPEIDLILLSITQQMQRTGNEMGTVLNSLLAQPDWVAPWATEQIIQNHAINAQALLLLTWLHHINANLTKASRFQQNPLWIANNVDRVLQEFSQTNGEDA